MPTQSLRQFLFAPRFHLNRLQFNLLALAFLLLGLGAGTYFALRQLYPTSFAVNDAQHSWVFDTGTAAQFSYDPSLIEFTTSGVKPKGNLLSNPTFESDTSGWTLNALPPAGWIEVPGDSNYGTSNFLAMKYEAKCASNASPGVGLEPVSGGDASGFDGYSDSGIACTNANGRQVVSTPSGFPIVNIDHNDAKTRCANITLPGGSPAHLLTNSEWMTMARNAEGQASNWSLGSVGAGYLYAGHNDVGPNKALKASTQETGGYRCAYTDGSTENPASCPSSTTNSASGPYQVRTHTLSNGSLAWDLAGNVWEHVQRDNPALVNPPSNPQGDDLSTLNPLPSCSNNTANWTWCQINNPASPYINNWTSQVTRQSTGPTNTNYTSSHGIGQVFTYGTGTSQGSSVFLRGANWYGNAGTGLFALGLNGGASYRGHNVGFRCASDSLALSLALSPNNLPAGPAKNFMGNNININIGLVSDARLFQTKALADNTTYQLSAWVYDPSQSPETSSVIGSSEASLYYEGAPLATTYSKVSDTHYPGWWRLTGNFTTAGSGNGARQVGVVVKAGKTLKVDNLTLAKSNSTPSFYLTGAYSNGQLNSWDSLCAGTLTGSDCTREDSEGEFNYIKYQLCTNEGSSCESGGNWQYWDGTNWQTATTPEQANPLSELTESALQALPIGSQKFTFKVIFNFEAAPGPLLPKLTVGLTTDTTPPSTNASAISMTRTNGGTSLASGDWTNQVAPYFSWSAGEDNAGGSGLRGYCLSLGLDANEDGLPDNNPATDKGLLGTSPASTSGTTCQFLVSGTSLDLANPSLRGDPWLTSSSKPYLLAVRAIDNGGNIYGGPAATFKFYFDNTPPTNLAYSYCPTSPFSNVVDMSFSWPTSGHTAAQDEHSQLLGWQYQLNGTAGAWLGSTSESVLGVGAYIPTTESQYNLTASQDGGAIVTGNNVVYLRAVDRAGNASSDASIRTCNLLYGGDAPTFNYPELPESARKVTVSPDVNTSNAYALSWPEAKPVSGNQISHYYFMTEAPPATLATLEANHTKYIDNGTSLTVPTRALPNVNNGSNTVYVVAVDNGGNYSPSNYLTGTFVLNSSNPDNVGSLVASDSSIKSLEQWNVTLTWAKPAYEGAGNLSYHILRSTDGIDFTEVGTTTGLSYVDSAPASRLYFYKVVTKDGVNAQSSGTNTVSLTPTGKWTEPPLLESGPKVSEITTRKATITWSTTRASDSKVQYGTTSGKYESVEPSNSTQVTSHSLQLTGLLPGTTYYYRAKWTDEDGNTGVSGEKSFVTAPAPTVQDVVVKNIGLTNAIVQFSVAGAAKVKIYYGTSTAFGALKEIATSTAETVYTAELSNLLDGTKYYFKINSFDTDGSEYEGTVLDFTTLPRPQISNVRVQQVANTAQSTLLVSWETNTETSSIVTFFPEGNPSATRNEVEITPKTKHQMIIRSLAPQTNYLLMARGRDKIGNEAVSSPQRVTTATDTRPPQISNLHIEGTMIPPSATTAQESLAQLVISWDTDEAATSQVEFGEGTGESYSAKTQIDGNLTTNHLVVISGLAPSKVYHLRALSTDQAGNLAPSVDAVTITPKTTDNALDLVIGNLRQIFGFLGNL